MGNPTEKAMTNETSTSPPIMLVEDDGGQALLVQKVLAKSGLTNPVRTFGDGQEAIAYLGGQGPYSDRTEHPLPAVALLDVHVPHKSGLEILTWLRQQSDLVNVPVIMLSGSSESTDIDRAFELGADTYLVKPVGFDALLDALTGLGLPWAIGRRHRPDHA
jgi:DNA-binding response OmpR family regulator